MKKLALVILLSATTMPAIAQKKPPTAPPAVNPEIAFVDTKTRYPEIKLANGDLTGAFAVFRSVAEYTMPRYDLSPRGQNQIAVTNGGAAEIVTWSSSGSAVTVTKEPLSAPGGRAGGVSFSPDGTRVAVFYDDYKMRIFDAATRQVLSEWPVPFVSSMTYYGDGSKIAFISYGQPSILELDVATGSVSSYPFTLGKLDHLGDGHGSNALVVTYRLNEAIPESLYFGRWEAGVMVNERIAQGWDAKYNCNETRIVYRATGMHPPTYIYNVTSNSGSILTKNSEVRRVDYIPTC